MKITHTPQEKIATEVQATKKVATIIKTSLIYLVTVLTAVTFLLHIFLKHPSSSLDDIRNERNTNRSIVELYKDSIVGLAGTTSKQNLLHLKSKLQLLNKKGAIINQRYSQQKTEARVSGFPSAHKFFWHFGIGLVISTLSIQLLFSIKRYTSYNKNAIRFAGLTAIMISGYYMAWIFFPYDDLPYNVYTSLLVLQGFLAVVVAYFLVKAHDKKQSDVLQLKLKINKALDFFVEVRNVHFKNIVKPVIEKDLYDEVLQEKVHQGTREFEQRMHDTADEILD